VKKLGRPTTFKPEYIEQARKLSALGHTDFELVQFFGVSLRTFAYWRSRNPVFLHSIRIGKKEVDERVERSLYQRAVGYSYETVKVFLPYGSKEPVYATYIEHVPPDTTAATWWLKNRNPAQWRDAWQLEHVTGRYVVSETTLTEEQWIKERGADVIEGEVVEQSAAIEPPEKK
jgi:hypothetical protein